MVLFWIPVIIRHLLFQVPRRDRNFDNHPFSFRNRISLNRLRIFFCYDDLEDLLLRWPDTILLGSLQGGRPTPKA